MQIPFVATIISATAIVAGTEGMALPGLGSGNRFFRPGTLTNGTPGRVLTKTFTYDSSKDLNDPCNSITGDPDKCLKSMEQIVPAEYFPAPSIAQPAPVIIAEPPRLMIQEPDMMEAELKATKDVAKGDAAEFDHVYVREPKRSSRYKYAPNVDRNRSRQQH